MRTLPVMADYAVYGGSLRSAIPFPQLRAASGSPTWRLLRASGPPASSAVELLGEDQVDGSLGVRLYRCGGGLRLQYDDTGTFDIDANGRDIAFREGARAPLEAVQLDVLGRVLPAALHTFGAICLHGSAVELAEGAVAFLAPSGSGKSTLAHALVRAGARLITDDVVALDLEPHGARMRPGLTQVRLRGDSARHLGVQDGLPLAAGGKVVIGSGTDSAAPCATLPVAALYLLQGVGGGYADGAVRGAPLGDVAAAMGLLAEARLARLLGRSEAPVLLDRAVRLARSAPVYALRVPRDFARLPAVAAQVARWHGGAPRPALRGSA